MFVNYVEVALRSFAKNKINFVIIVAGLSLGMLCPILIMAFVSDELLYKMKKWTYMDAR